MSTICTFIRVWESKSVFVILLFLLTSAIVSGWSVVIIGCPSSVVRRSSVVRPSFVRCLSTLWFKQHLLIYWVVFQQILQHWSLDGPLLNLFNDINSIQSSGCNGNQNEIYLISCQKPLCRFENILAQMVLVNLYQDCSNHIDPSKNMAASVGMGAILPNIWEHFKKSYKNLLNRFENNSAQMALRWS